MRHTVNPDGGELLAFLQCFPKLRNLAISWSRRGETRDNGRPGFSMKRTPGPATGVRNLDRLQILLHADPSDGEHSRSSFARGVLELVALCEHLPLHRLKHFGVFFEAFVDSDSIPEYLAALIMAVGMMRFKRLESFHFGFDFMVWGLPALNLWVRLLSDLYGCVC
jgi:hypothetical protein